MKSRLLEWDGLSFHRISHVHAVGVLADVAIEKDMLDLRLRAVDEQHLTRGAVAVVGVPKPSRVEP